MKFGFLLFDDLEELDLVGPWEMVGMWREMREAPLEMIAIGEHGGTIACRKGLKLLADRDYASTPELDYLLVPGGQGQHEQCANPATLDFVKRQARSCRIVLSVCTGAFILHAAGLLDGAQATTHWRALPELRRKGVSVREERFVCNDGVWTAAGVSAGIDMALALIAHVDGEEMAGRVQLAAEYYPAATRFGTAHRAAGAPAYLKEGIRAASQRAG